MNVVLYVLAVQGLIGALDNLWHHAITEQLHRHRSARRELALHAARELLYGAVFVVLAWWQPHGLAALALIAVLVLEIVITLLDFLEEDATRRLPRLERVLHTLLAINYGVFTALLCPYLWQWLTSDTALVPASYGWLSVLLSLYGIGVTLWGLADVAAVANMYRPPVWVRAPLTGASTASGRTVVVTGATGFVARHLIRALVADGDRVIAVSREPARAAALYGPAVSCVPSVDAIDAHSTVHSFVHLGGAAVLGWPWTRRRRRTLIASRIAGARAIARFARRAERRPDAVVLASAVGWYGVRDTTSLAEGAVPGSGFQSELCLAVEASGEEIARHGVRVVALRMGLVLGRDGGALPALARPVRLGLGARLGTGRAWLSWIHIRDLVALIRFALTEPAAVGPINATATPVTYAHFNDALATSLGRRIRLRLPAWPLRALLGEMAELLVDGQRVEARRATALGFEFAHPDIDAALADLHGATHGALAPGPLKVYFNGECPLGGAHLRRLHRQAGANAGGLEIIDVCRRPGALQSHSLRFDDVERRIYVRDVTGTLQSGWEALVTVWARIPAYRGWVRWASQPLLRPLLSAIYDLLLSPALTALARARRLRRLRGMYRFQRRP